MRGWHAGPAKAAVTDDPTFFNTSLNWCHLNWLLIRHHVLDADDVVLMSGDHVVVTKAGKMTYGLDRFFRLCMGRQCRACVF